MLFDFSAWLRRQWNGAPTRPVVRRPAPRTRPALDRLESREVMATLGYGVWTAVGPSPLYGTGVNPVPVPNSGRVVALAPHPTNSNILYAGAASGGVWKTLNANDAFPVWEPLTDDQASLFTGSLAIDPNNPNIIYAGTGEPNNSGDSFTGKGLLKSVNGGETWTLLGRNEFAGRSVSRIIVHPRNPLIVYATTAGGVNGDPGATYGVWRSVNGGGTWTNITATSVTGTTSEFSDLVMDPTNPEILYAAVGELFPDPKNGVYKITGASSAAPQVALVTGLPHNNTDPASPKDVGRITLAVSKPFLGPNGAQTFKLYTAVINTSFQNSAQFGALNALYRSDDGGQTFVPLFNAPNYTGQQGWYDTAIAVSPNDPNTVVVGGAAGPDHIIRSTDGGDSWTRIVVDANGNGPHVDHHALAYDAAGNLINGNDGGVWRYQGNTWFNLNSNLQITQFVGVGAHPTDRNTIAGGTQDNGTLLYSGGTTGIWNETFGGDGGEVVINPASPNIVYKIMPPGSFFQFFHRSLDGGQTWTWENRVQGAQININEPMNFYPPFIIDPGNPDRVVVGTNRLYAAVNARGTGTPGQVQPMQWFPLGTMPPGTNGAPIDSIAISPSNPSVIYVAVGDQVFVSTDNAQTWTARRPSPTSNGATFHDMTVDPTNPNVVYVVAASNILNSAGHVFRSTDGGATWANVSLNLPDTPTWSIILDARNPGVADDRLFVGTDQGVYVSGNGGADWAKFAQGLPNVQVRDLEYSPLIGILTAGTYGRGVWQTSLINQPPVLAAPTGQLTVAEDGALAVLGVSVSDPDVGSNFIQVQVSAAFGVVSMQVTPDLQFVAGDGTRDRTFTVRGTEASINRALRTLAYFPNRDYNGQDAITITTNDLGSDGAPGAAGTDTATVAILVTPVADAPHAVADFVRTAEDTTLQVPVLTNDRDPDGDRFALYDHSQPKNGRVEFRNDQLFYIPNANFYGQDSFVYVIRDATGLLSTGSVYVTVTPVNDPPTANPDRPVVREDSAILVNVKANDTIRPDFGETTRIIGFTRRTAHGTVVQVGQSLRYTPDRNFNGVDRFSYQLMDSNGAKSNIALVTVTVLPVNDAPRVGGDRVTTLEDRPVVTGDVRANDTVAPDTGETLTVVGSTRPRFGTIVYLGNGRFRYTPNANFKGTDSFTYTVRDSGGARSTGTVVVSVQAAADDPIARTDAVRLDEDTQVILNPLANDAARIAGRTLRVSAVGRPAHGTVVRSGDTLRYIPARNYFGPDRFTYTVTDSAGDSSVGVVVVAVLPVNNDPPSARSDAASVNEGRSVLINVLANDSSAPDQPEAVRLASFAQPANGTVVRVGNQLRYTPTRGYFGRDSFRYTITDAHGDAASANVGVNVLPVNQRPVNTVPGTQTLRRGFPVVFSQRNGNAITVSDREAERFNGRVQVQLSVTAGYLTIQSARNVAYSGNRTNRITLTGSVGAVNTALEGLTFRLAAGQFAPRVGLTVRTTDLGDFAPPRQTDADTVTIVVTNRAPTVTASSAEIAAATRYTTAQNTAVTSRSLTGLFGDPDGDPLRLALASRPTAGTVVINRDGSFTYTPPRGFSGRATFAIRATDGGAFSTSLTVTIDVAGSDGSIRR